MHNYAIIVAGGKGNRMQSEKPKQFLILNNKPVLMHTISAFYNYDTDLQLVVVLPHDQIQVWNELVEQYKFEIKHQIISGGASRFDSVKNGLDSIESNQGLIAIHDGVRPLVTHETIKNCFSYAKKLGNAIASVDLKDSLRRVSESNNEAVNREHYKIIQTPQTFDLRLIKDAFFNAEGNSFTDDASVLEKFGREINLVDGDYANIKITTPSDLILAESLLNEVK